MIDYIDSVREKVLAIFAELAGERAPNHIREACRLTGQYVWESFPEDDEGST
jgi:hypothetical protein